MQNYQDVLIKKEQPISLSKISNYDSTKGWDDPKNIRINPKRAKDHPEAKAYD